MIENKSRFFAGMTALFTNLSFNMIMADADIIFLPSDLYLLSFFTSRLISAVAEWIFAILLHIVWP